MSSNASTLDSQGESSQHSAMYRTLADILSQAGIRINGGNPWDIQLHRAGVPERAFAQGNLGLGEAYMDGDWDAEHLDEFSPGCCAPGWPTMSSRYVCSATCLPLNF